MNEEIQALREELVRLRERVAVLEAGRAPVPVIDWTRPLQIGSPRFVQAGEVPPWTITCSADARQ